MAALSSKPVSPLALNPYRRKQRQGMSVKQFQEFTTERFTALKSAGKFETQTISASQVENYL